MVTELARNEKDNNDKVNRVGVGFPRPIYIKFEARISKSETNSNFSMTKCLKHWIIEILIIVSEFGFRISGFWLSASVGGTTTSVAATVTTMTTKTTAGTATIATTASRFIPGGASGVTSFLLFGS